MNFKDEYKAAYDDISLTEEEKESLLNSVMDNYRAVGDDVLAGVKRGTFKKVPKKRRWALGVAVAAVTSVMLVGAAGAAGTLTPASDAFKGFFGMGPAETEIIDSIGHPIGATAAADGVEITAEAVIGDGNTICIVYTITLTDGTTFAVPEDDQEYIDFQIMHDISFAPAVMGGAHGSYGFKDLVPGDNQVHLISDMTFDKPVNGKTAHVEMSDFIYKTSAGETVTKDLTWKMSFKAEYEDSTINLGGGQTFSMNDLDFTINSVNLSPISIEVDCTVAAELPWDNQESGKMNDKNAKAQDRFFDSIPIQIVMNNGTIIDMTHSGGSLEPSSDTTHCVKGGFLDTVINVNDVDKVIVADLEYPVK